MQKRIRSIYVLLFFFFFLRGELNKQKKCLMQKGKIPVRTEVLIYMCTFKVLYAHKQGKEVSLSFKITLKEKKNS